MFFCPHFSVFLWCCLIFCLPAKACEMTFRIYTFPPLAMQDQQGHWHGLDLDYAKALMKQIECDIKIVNVPWARGIELLKTGEVDFMVNVSKNSEREKYFHFVGPYRTENVRLVSKKGGFKPVKTWAELESLDVMLMRQKGSYFGERFERLVTTNEAFSKKLVELPSNLTRLELLQKGRIGGFMADELFVDYQDAESLKSGALFKHPIIIYSNPVYYAFSKVNVDDKKIRHIRRAFNAMSKSKAYQQIEGKYAQ